MADDEECEYEYEYDDTETEDFYIPVEMSHVPGPQARMDTEKHLGHSTMQDSRLRPLNSVRGQLPEIPETLSDASKETVTMGEVQITGLHTSNPLIMYNGQLLSCQWTSTIGTDMFFAKPDTNSGSPHQSLRSLQCVDLVSMGTAKLVARVGRLRPRDDVIDSKNDALVQVDAHDTEMKVVPSVAPSQDVNGGLPSTSNNHQSAPSNFLARLNEAKARRGDNSRLIVNRAQSGPRLVSEYVELPMQPGNDEPVQSHGDVAMGGT